MHLHVEGVFTICLMLTLFCAGWFFSFFKEKESKVKLFGSSLSVKLVVFTAALSRLLQSSHSSLILHMCLLLCKAKRMNL